MAGVALVLGIAVMAAYDLSQRAKLGGSVFDQAAPAGSEKEEGSASPMLRDYLPHASGSVHSLYGSPEPAHASLNMDPTRYKAPEDL